MSYSQRPYANGSTNGNTNGNHNNVSYMNGASLAANSDRLRRFDFETTPDTSADERSRSRGPGGYGGFGAQQQSSQIQAPSHLDRRQANRRSRDQAGYGYDSSRSRSRGAPAMRRGPQGNNVDEILRYIGQHWSFMANDSCIPIKVALQLMDPSSLGLADQYDQFQDVHQQLQNALKIIVNEHHQGFNSSIGTFHKIQAAIHASQQRVRTLRASLVQAKESLSTAKPELRTHAASSRSYDQMLQTIADIETLQGIPDLLDAQTNEKRFLGAVTTLQEGLTVIRKPEMEDIGALSELRLRLSNQEQYLSDHLIEELHNHLYLKSPYCEERWKSHSKRDLAESATVSDDDRAMWTFLDGYDGRQEMQEDTTRNPEAGSFYYIQVLVESLNRMGRLEQAVDEIERRLPVELFRVVERSHGEVEQRHPTTMRSAAARQRQLELSAGHGPDSEQRAILEDLLRTLYAKFEAIAEGHRVLHDVTAAITRREAHLAHGDTSSVNRSFRELWKLLQSEIRSLLHDHLTITGASGLAGRTNRENDINLNMFRPTPRDKTKKLFRAAETADAKAGGDSDMAIEKEDLMNMLKDSVPGLVNTDLQTSQASRDRLESERVMAEKSATGHKLLVEPRLFNMSTLLPPSLSFLHHLRTIVPASSGVIPSTLTSFLDDFLINVFYPQLDETLLDLCSAATSDAEAFTIDPGWAKFSARPVFKGAVRVLQVIEGVCKMLDALPHEQSFSSLVVGQMREYYDRCYVWSKGLLQRAVSAPGSNGTTAAGGAENVVMRMRLAADLATAGDINDTIIEVLTLDTKPDLEGGDATRDRTVLVEKESALLLNLVRDREVEEADLINDRKALSALCTMHVSMKWLAAKCQKLRYLSPRAIDMGSADPAANISSANAGGKSKRWTQNTAGSLQHLPGEPTGAYLPLDPTTAPQFDAVVVSFTELSHLLLRTLHVDLRLQLLYGLTRAMSSTYALGQPYNDPDPAILDLAKNLSTYDAAVAPHLMAQQHEFLLNGLEVLAGNAVVSMVKLMPSLDDHGLARLQLNILVLQQTLKTLSPASTTSNTLMSHSASTSSSLTKAASFYALPTSQPGLNSNTGCDNILNAGKKNNTFGKDDLEALVRLCWRADREGTTGVGDVEAYVARLRSEGGGAGAGAGGAGGAFPKRGVSLSRKRSEQMVRRVGGGTGTGSGTGTGASTPTAGV
ncbi:exocyst subunit [Recurvomyces mirabilis]|nr:exocyst subunit [Recurvomyces mirabilis]